MQYPSNRGIQYYASLLSVLLVAAAIGPAGGIAAVSPVDATADARETNIAPGMFGVYGPVAADRRSGVGNGQSDTCSFPYTATDDTGAEVTVDADPDRIVTLNPNVAQTM